MRVGTLTIEPDVLLAPMAAVTDLPFRTVCEELGVGLTITEFLSAHALTDGEKKTIDKMTRVARRAPVRRADLRPRAGVMARAARMAVAIGASLVDINMGCPAKRVVAGACGSALMKEPEIAQELVRAVRRRGARAHAGDGQASRRLGRGPLERARVRVRDGRGRRRDDHGARPHPHAGLLRQERSARSSAACATRCPRTSR